MAKDKHGKVINVGDVVRTPNGETFRVKGVIDPTFKVCLASLCETLTTTAAAEGLKQAADGGDGLAWGN